MTGSADRASRPAGIGLRALKGGSVAVCVAVDKSTPSVVLSSFLATAAPGDLLSLEPYHAAAEMVRKGASHAQAAAAVSKGRKVQEQLASQGLQAIVRQLPVAQCGPLTVALLVNRSSWIPDLLKYSLAFPDHPPVAEGLAVREALRLAARQASLELLEMDEKSLHGLASEALRLSKPELDARLKDLGKTAGRPWRKEQKVACLAAWVAAAQR